LTQLLTVEVSITIAETERGDAMWAYCKARPTSCLGAHAPRAVWLPLCRKNDEVNTLRTITATAPLP
jgi:hypothetical protein